MATKIFVNLPVNDRFAHDDLLSFFEGLRFYLYSVLICSLIRRMSAGLRDTWDKCFRAT